MHEFTGAHVYVSITMLLGALACLPPPPAPAPYAAPVDPGRSETVRGATPEGKTNVCYGPLAPDLTKPMPDPAIARQASDGLAALAAAEAPRAAKEGDALGATLQQGQSIEQAFILTPGKCYTLVALSDGIEALKLEVETVEPTPGTQAILGQTNAVAGKGGVRASLGGREQCLQHALLPIAVRAHYTLTAVKGGGSVAAQLYVR